MSIQRRTAYTIKNEGSNSGVVLAVTDDVVTISVFGSVKKVDIETVDNQDVTMSIVNVSLHELGTVIDEMLERHYNDNKDKEANEQAQKEITEEDTKCPVTGQCPTDCKKKCCQICPKCKDNIDWCECKEEFAGDPTHCNFCGVYLSPGVVHTVICPTHKENTPKIVNQEAVFFKERLPVQRYRENTWHSSARTPSYGDDD